mgnify:CR=1 FL=1|tara:strand:+ start:651 stop:1661 length:1011 start_codon:yes stop_codon:yes gene_type:complete
MSELHNIYSGLQPSCSNELCDGCTILTQSKPEYTYLDYEKLTEGPVLFLSDSFRSKFGKLDPFSKKEKELLNHLYPGTTQFSAAVKCPTVKEADMTPNNMVLCRSHLEATIDKVKPRLVYVCGNLAMKMLIKKSGIMNKRGSSHDFTTSNGHTCIVVPIYHPYAVLKEPRHRYLFETDIKNAYEKYVLGKKTERNFTYKVLEDPRQVSWLANELKDTEATLAVDIETTGLNFRTDKIMSIAISSGDKTWVIPLEHKDSPLKGDPYVWSHLRTILGNPANKKVFHNAKFDLKFLIRYNVKVTNVWDTKIMHHFINETAPKSLMDLIKLYFADELENL